MFKAANKDSASPPTSIAPAQVGSSCLSSQAATLRVTSEGLNIVGDGGVLGTGKQSSSQQKQKQKFFATRSADGNWNLLMAPTSDPSRLFLVQPAPGHKFQMTGGKVRMESSDSVAESNAANGSSANGCEEDASSHLSTTETAEPSPGTSKSIAVPVAQLKASSSVSLMSSCTSSVSSSAGTTAASVEPVLFNPPEHKKPTFFKSRTAKDREALKASAQHALGKFMNRKGNKCPGNMQAGQSSKQGKKGRSPGNSKPHKTVSSSLLASDVPSTFPPMATCSNTPVPRRESTTTVSSLQTSASSSTSVMHSSSLSLVSNSRQAISVHDSSLDLSPSSSPTQNTINTSTSGNADHVSTFTQQSGTSDDITGDEDTHNMAADNTEMETLFEQDSRRQSEEGMCGDVEDIREANSNSAVENPSMNTDYKTGESLEHCDCSGDEQKAKAVYVLKDALNTGGEPPPSNLSDVQQQCSAADSFPEDRSPRPTINSVDAFGDTSGESPKDVTPDVLHGVESISDKLSNQLNEAFQVLESGDSCQFQIQKQVEHSKLTRSCNPQNSGEGSRNVSVSLNNEKIQHKAPERKECSDFSSDTDDYDFVFSDAELETKTKSAEESVAHDDTVSGNTKHDSIPLIPTAHKDSIDQVDVVTETQQECSKLDGNQDSELTPLNPETNTGKTATEHQSHSGMQVLHSEKFSKENDSLDLRHNKVCEEKESTEENLNDSHEFSETQDRVNEYKLSENKAAGVFHDETLACADKRTEPSFIGDSDPIAAEVVSGHTHAGNTTSVVHGCIQKKRKKRKSELDVLIESSSQDFQILEEFQSSGQIPADTDMVEMTQQENPAKKRKKRKNELDYLLEMQMVETGVPEIPDGVGNGESEKDAEMVHTSAFTSGIQDAGNRGNKQKKKKKKKLKICINLNEAKSTDVTSDEQPIDEDTSASVSQSTGIANSEPHSDDKNCSDSQGLSQTDQEQCRSYQNEPEHIHLSENSDTFNCDEILKLQSSEPTTDKTKKKSKKKKRLKIVFGSNQVTSTRVIPSSANVEIGSLDDVDSMSKRNVDDSVRTLQSETLPDFENPEQNNSLTDVTQPKKKRKKRLNELQTLIHDQKAYATHTDTLTTNTNDSNSENNSEPIFDVDKDETHEPDVTKSFTSQKHHLSERNGLEISTTPVETGEQTSTEALRKSSQDTHEQQLKKDAPSVQVQKKTALHSVKGKVDKPKKKARKLKVTTAGAILMPPVTQATDTDVMRIEGVETGSTGNTDLDFSLTTDASQSDEPGRLMDAPNGSESEDEEARYNRAMKKMLTSRSFGKWELVRMFGSPFVVLERLSDQDVYFMSRRFRNARVSSRARCSDHCRLRTLGYLCELNLIDCKPPPMSPQPFSESPRNATGEPPRKKKRKRKQKEGCELNDNTEEKKKKKKKRNLNSQGKGSDGDSDVVIVTDSPNKTTNSAPALQENTITTSATSLLPSFPSASFGRIRIARDIGQNVVSSNQAITPASPCLITVAPTAPSRTSLLPQIYSIPSLPSASRPSGLPQVFAISPLGTAISSANKIIPVLVNTTSSSLKDATRASLTQAISNSLCKTRLVTTRPAAPVAAPSVPSISAHTASLLPKGPLLVQASADPQTSSVLPKGPLIIQATVPPLSDTVQPKGPLMVQAATVQPKGPLMVQAAPVQPKGPLMVQAATVQPKGPLMVQAATVQPKGPLMVQATTVQPKGPLMVQAANVQPKGPLMVQATTVQPKGPLMVQATTVQPKGPLMVQATPVQPKGPLMVQATVASSTAPAAQGSTSTAKQFLVVQMGDKRMFVPTASLSTPSTTPTVLTTTVAATTTVAPTPCLLQPSAVSLGAVSVQQSAAAVPTIITAPATGVQQQAAPLIPGSMARFVLSNRRPATPSTPRTGPTASTLLFARGTRPNQAWTGPRTVDSQRRLMVTPGSQPQGVRVVLSGANPLSSGTRFTVSSSRGGVFVSSRQPTSVVRAASPRQSRPGKRMMTEEERLRKRARLEKKYPLPPGVVIKTEPVTRGYNDEGKTTQANSSARVVVSTVPVASSSRTHVNLTQPIPVLSAFRGPIVIRQTVPASSSIPRSTSLIGPLIIRMPNAPPNTSTFSASCATSTVTATTASSLLSSLNRTCISTSASLPLTYSLLSGNIRATTATTPSSNVTVVSSTSVVSHLPPQTSAESRRSVNQVPVSLPSASSSVPIAQNDNDDDAIYIVDSPPAVHTSEIDNTSSSHSESSAVERVTPVPTTSCGTSDVTSSSCTSAGPVPVSSAAAVSVATTVVFTSQSPIMLTSPMPSTSTSAPSSRMASLGAMWARQVTESPDSAPSIDTSSLKAERLQRLKDFLAKQMENMGDERRQKALQAIHHQFSQTGSPAENVSEGHSEPVEENSSMSDSEHWRPETANKSIEGSESVADCEFTTIAKEKEGTAGGSGDILILTAEDLAGERDSETKDSEDLREEDADCSAAEVEHVSDRQGSDLSQQEKPEPSGVNGTDISEDTVRIQGADQTGENPQAATAGERDSGGCESGVTQDENVSQVHSVSVQESSSDLSGDTRCKQKADNGKGCGSVDILADTSEYSVNPPSEPSCTAVSEGGDSGALHSQVTDDSQGDSAEMNNGTDQSETGRTDSDKCLSSDSQTKES
ncbi:uncharacterized protein LOC143297671 [Babylonia areolata]|uniref:uncharacterized protein LOC143297671 n=1 Tax=Babylonia areolata TaxID=304850 RepID=UPI003FCF8D2F